MRHRAARVILQIGLVAVVLAALPYREFELDRYFVPKELVLHIAALALAVLVLIRARDSTTDVVDLLLAVFLVWSLASALFATNYWLAQRAVAVSVSSVILFWGARRIGTEGRYRSVLVAAGFATVCAAATGLAQAYGLFSDYFSQNRAPGGTFGNRNFVAHFCAIGLPALLCSTVTARRSIGALLGCMGVGAVAALIVLTRSRAAWLAVAATLAVFIFALFASRRYWRREGARTGGRLALSALAATVGVASAIALPNNLNWRSDSPYLESALEIADYSSGSGRGRLAQYVNSMRVATADPVFGAGPGNWPVRYVRFAPAGDKSLTDDGMTANPWPSSDWVAYVSERGIVAAIALLGAFVVLFISAFRKWSALGEPEAVLTKVTLAGTIAATGVVSAFDAVLLLAAPAFLAWTVIGVTSGLGQMAHATSGAALPVQPPTGVGLLASEPAGVGPLVVEPIGAGITARDPVGTAVTERESNGPPRWWRPATIAMLLITVVSVARSGAQMMAISTIGLGGGPASWVSAAAWDPGSYRIALRAAELQAARGRCGASRAHARRARDLFPHAAAPRRVLQRCG